MKSTRQYDFTLTAGGAFVLPVVGSYFRILSCTGALEVQGDTFGRVPVLSGQGLRDQDFAKLTLVDKSGSPNVGVILVSDGSFVDDRITGEVSFIDGGKARTIAGSAFVASSAMTPGGSNISQVSICNPVSSGRRVVINSIMVSCQIASSVSLSFGSGVPLGTQIAPLAKSLASGAACVAQKFDSYVLTASQGAGLLAMSLQAGQSSTIPITEPITIEPGRYLNISCPAPTSTFYCTVQFFEESV
jgi:hypothetical protein